MIFTSYNVITLSYSITHCYNRCADRDSMELIIKKAIVARDINHKGQGLWVTMRKLLGDLAQVGFIYLLMMLFSVIGGATNVLDRLDSL